MSSMWMLVRNFSRPVALVAKEVGGLQMQCKDKESIFYEEKRRQVRNVTLFLYIIIKSWLCHWKLKAQLTHLKHQHSLCLC